MIVEKNSSFQDYKFIKGHLKFAVIGHIEWINFIKVDQLPKPGLISHSKESLESVSYTHLTLPTTPYV